ncbi:hypothetical protein [uncultured Roseobacter sp.]|uniref:hypothetical protein n=1 Tax=uncultured Roseobacter sp. TaxID=114847 RepID=UPI0026096003|nr:hypothetical protein [uncultured Roseobacter sp.]
MSNELEHLHQYEPSQTGSLLQEKWLDVQAAVDHCQMRGLTRTPKTVRKWAKRSHQDPDNGDICARREDIATGHRWLIELTSLDRKIDEELEFEARNGSEPVQTTPNLFTPKTVRDSDIYKDQPGSHQPEPAHVSSNKGDLIEAQLREQLEDAKEQITFLREELKHRRTTDEALANVIEAFRLNAENGQAQAIKEASRSEKPSWVGERRQDIVRPDIQSQ